MLDDVRVSAVYFDDSSRLNGVASLQRRGGSQPEGSAVVDSVVVVVAAAVVVVVSTWKVGSE